MFIAGTATATGGGGLNSMVNSGFPGPSALFNGYYFYGDYCSDVVWLAIEGDSGWSSAEWPLAAPTLNSISSFGEDGQGNLYIADRNDGKVYQISITSQIFADSFE